MAAEQPEQLGAAGGDAVERGRSSAAVLEAGDTLVFAQVEGENGAGGRREVAHVVVLQRQVVEASGE
jgi:hypothetical protein